FVRQYDVREDRSGLELELVQSRIENGNAENVGGQQVAGELNAMEAAVERTRQCMTECGFTDSGNVFDQQMPFGDQGDDRKLDRFFLTLDRAANRVLESSNLVVCGDFYRFHRFRRRF